MSFICLIANRSASTEPVSLIAIVPVIECNCPTVTVVSVTASPVLQTSDVGNSAFASSDAGNANRENTARIFLSDRLEIFLMYMILFRVKDDT